LQNHHATAEKRQEFANKVSAAVDAAASNKLTSLSGGVRSAPPFVHHHINVSGSRTTHVSIDAVVVEKQKCYPIYVSGVIDSIDNSQSVRYYYIFSITSQIIALSSITGCAAVCGAPAVTFA
jgi:hypothetical protein